MSADEKKPDDIIKRELSADEKLLIQDYLWKAAKFVGFANVTVAIVYAGGLFYAMRRAVEEQIGTDLGREIVTCQTMIRELQGRLVS